QTGATNQPVEPLVEVCCSPGHAAILHLRQSANAGARARQLFVQAAANPSEHISLPAARPGTTPATNDRLSRVCMVFTCDRGLVARGPPGMSRDPLKRASEQVLYLSGRRDSNPRPSPWQCD